jgi:hypothetical protein
MSLTFLFLLFWIYDDDFYDGGAVVLMGGMKHCTIAEMRDGVECKIWVSFMLWI